MPPGDQICLESERCQLTKMDQKHVDQTALCLSFRGNFANMGVISRDEIFATSWKTSSS